MKRIGCIAALITTLLFTSFGIAAAQDQAAPPIQTMPQRGMMGQGGGMPMMSGPGRMGMMGMTGIADHIEGRIAFLKAELKITEAQMPQWNAFAEALRANARRMSEMPAIMMQSGMTAQESAPVSPLGPRLPASRPGRNERLARFVANTADHGFESVRSLRSKVLAQSEAVEQCQRIDIKNLARRLS